MNTRTYPHLFSPLQVGHMMVRNRIMQSGHGKLWSYRGGETKRNFDYHVARARGGLGLIVTGIHVVHPSAPLPRVALAYVRRNIGADQRLTAAVHEHGARILAQLGHTGSMFSSDLADDLRVLWAPSAIRMPVTGEMPQAMEVDEISEMVDWWRRGALIAQESGFDGVELHFAHSYLMHQFLSTTYNNRTDEYGGSVENRTRFAREVIAAVRIAVGRTFVVGARIGVSDFIDGGYDVADAVAVATRLASTGELDYFSCSVGGLEKAIEIAPSDIADGHLIAFIAPLKAALPIPIFAVGGIRTPRQADQIIADGTADMVAMTRAQIADPQFANKARTGRENEIYHCIKANQGCIGRGNRGLPIACTVNPEAGREGFFARYPARTPSPRNWLVVGGGPAGMKAAEVLAQRGHRVALHEQQDSLGGQVQLILKTPGREPLRALIDDLTTHMATHDVSIHLNSHLTASDVRDLNTDAVIIATGAVPSRTGYSVVAPLVPSIPGLDSAKVLTPWDVLQGPGPCGERVLVLDDDGTRYSAGTAEVLLDRGNEVHLVTRLNALFPSTYYTADITLIYKRLFEKGLHYRLNSWVRRLGSDHAMLVNIYTGAEDTLSDVDSVVLATGPVANDRLYFELKGNVANLYRIGDCVAPRKLDHAIFEGYLAGRELLKDETRFLADGDLESWDVSTQELLSTPR